MKKQLNLLVFILAFSFFSCSDDITGSETTITKTYEVGAFNNLAISNGCEVKVEKDTVQNVEITINENIERYVEVFVKDATLNIRMRDGFNYNKKTFKANIKIPSNSTSIELKDIVLSGGTVCNIKNPCNTLLFNVTLSGGSILNCNMVSETSNVVISGGSILNIKGHTITNTITASGGSIIEAANFFSSHCTVVANGASIVNIYADNTLNVVGSGASIIKYSGNPTITGSVLSGGSQLIKL